MQTNFFSFSVLHQSSETYEMTQNKRVLLGSERHWEEAALSSEVLIPIYQTTWLHIPEHCGRNILSCCRCRETVKLFLFLLSPYSLLETCNSSDIYQESQNKRKHLERIHPYSACCQKSWESQPCFASVSFLMIKVVARVYWRLSSTLSLQFLFIVAWKSFLILLGTCEWEKDYQNHVCIVRKPLSQNWVTDKIRNSILTIGLLIISINMTCTIFAHLWLEN